MKSFALRLIVIMLVFLVALPAAQAQKRSKKNKYSLLFLKRNGFLIPKTHLLRFDAYQYYIANKVQAYNDLLNDIRNEYYECLTGARVNFEGKLITIEDSIFSNDKNYIGIREMFEKIGYKVGWDNNTKTVIINK